jgi:dienelactone hydrolase
MLALLFPVALLLSATVTVDPLSPQDPGPALWAGLTPGPYRVGYQRLTPDSTVVHTWYPTSATGAPLRFRDYLGDGAEQLASFLGNTGTSQATVDSLFASSLYAVPSPRSIGRPFPLVLIAQGNSHDVIDQVILCEYLASQGFVVAATPSPMVRSPIEREEQVGTFAETQAAELAATIGAIATTLPVDTEHVGVVGHSFGARAALLLAMQNRRVKAIVSLDGGIGTSTAAESFRRAPSFRADAPLPPLLHFFEELDAFVAPDFAMLKSLRSSELLLEPTEAMHHVHFTTYGFAAALFPDLARATRATPTTGKAVTRVAELTANFLRRSLR